MTRRGRLVVASVATWAGWTGGIASVGPYGWWHNVGLVLQAELAVGGLLGAVVGLWWLWTWAARPDR
jgi:hypothetical protein